MIFLSFFMGLMNAAATSALFDTTGLIEQALDEPTKITLETVKLVDAIQAVTEQTGVRIVMSAEVMGLVPQGAETVIQKVDIARVPLREGLTRLFAPLGMDWRVREDGVEVIPKEAIACLGRAPTWGELQLLSELAATSPGLDEAALGRLQSKVQFQVPETGGTWLTLSAAIRSVGAGPGDEVLTAACNKLGWAWCLSGERLLITSIGEHVRRRLQQPVSLRMNNRPLFDVLSAVSGSAGVPVRVEPGTLTTLPINLQRNFSLNVQQQSVEQVLDSIAAYTGLGYMVGPDGVMFYRPELRGGGESRAMEPAAAQTATPSSSNPYVGKVVVPLPDGRSMEWLIRASELPEDLRQMREQDIQEVIDALRRKAAQTSQRP